MKAALHDYKKCFEQGWEHDINKDNDERLEVNHMIDFVPTDFTIKTCFTAEKWINKKSVIGPGARGLYRMKKTYYFKVSKVHVSQKVLMVCVGHEKPLPKKYSHNKEGTLVKKRQRSS